jgi:hypothetical protein
MAINYTLVLAFLASNSLMGIPDIGHQKITMFSRGLPAKLCI